MSWVAASFLLSWLCADKQWGKPAWEQRFICLLSWAAQPGGHPWKLPPQPLGVLPWGTPGKGSVTHHRRDRRGVPRAEGRSGDSLQFFRPARLRPTSLRHRTPPPVSAFATCECMHSSWMAPPPPIVPCSRSSLAPYCPIGSFINIWLGPLCRLHSPPFSPKVLLVLSQAFVVLSLGCRTLCPP